MTLAIDAKEAWDYCLGVFADPQRAGALIAAQDEQGLDVVLSLFTDFLRERHAIALSEAQRAQAQASVRAWRDEAILPLRALRRALKKTTAPQPGGAGAAQAVRALVQEAELRAERVELDALCAWAVTALKG